MIKFRTKFINRIIFISLKKECLSTDDVRNFFKLFAIICFMPLNRRHLCAIYNVLQQRNYIIIFEIINLDKIVNCKYNVLFISRICALYICWSNKK